MTIELIVNGRQIATEHDAASLLDVLRDDLAPALGQGRLQPTGPVRLLHRARRRAAARLVRDAGAPRRRPVDRHPRGPRGRRRRDRWADAFCATGASQCGFCTPGHHHATRRRCGDAQGVRRTSRPTRPGPVDRRAAAGGPPVPLHRVAHDRRGGTRGSRRPTTSTPAGRDLDRPRRGAPTLEGGAPQRVGPDGVRSATAASPTTPRRPTRWWRCRTGDGGWVVGETLAEARSGAAQGAGPAHAPSTPQPPLELPAGRLGSHAAHVVGRAGLPRDRRVVVRARRRAGVSRSPTVAPSAARSPRSVPMRRRRAGRRARPAGRACVLSREDTVRLGPKRPPIAAGVRADGTGVMRVVAHRGIWPPRSVRAAPTLSIEEVDVAGPPTSIGVRGVGWVEPVVLLAVVARRRGRRRRPAAIDAPNGASAEVTVGADGALGGACRLRAAARRDRAALVLHRCRPHGAELGHVRGRSPSTTTGAVHDLTIRSFGVAARRRHAVRRRRDRRSIRRGEPVNGSDAVFAAVAAAVWRAPGLPAGVADAPTLAVLTGPDRSAGARTTPVGLREDVAPPDEHAPRSLHADRARRRLVGRVGPGRSRRRRAGLRRRRRRAQPGARQPAGRCSRAKAPRIDHVVKTTRVPAPHARLLADERRATPSSSASTVPPGRRSRSSSSRPARSSRSRPGPSPAPDAPAGVGARARRRPVLMRPSAGPDCRGARSDHHRRRPAADPRRWSS